MCLIYSVANETNISVQVTRTRTFCNEIGVFIKASVDFIKAFMSIPALDGQCISLAHQQMKPFV